MADAINPVDNGEDFDFEGQKINLHDFTPIVFKHLVKVILKNPEKSEMILSFVVDAIHYSTGMTDEPPEVVYYSNPVEAEKYLSSGHDEPKVKIKTK